jgi:RNA polymerase sigma factor (sigma-70 family)
VPADERESIYQEFFLKHAATPPERLGVIASHDGEYPPELAAWICNSIHQYFRTTEKRGRDWMRRPQSLLDTLADDRFSRSALMHEIEMTIAELAQRFDVRQVEAFRLRYIDLCTISQTAEAIGCTDSQVEYASKKFVAALQKEFLPTDFR